MKRLLLLLALLLSLSACAAEPETGPDAVTGNRIAETVSAEAAPAPAELTEEELRDRELDKELRQRLSEMTLEEKVGQLFFVRCTGDSMAELITRYHLGGVLLFSRDYKDKNDNWLSREALTAKIESYKSASDLPLFIGSDEEGGTVTRASRNPNLFDKRFRSPQQIWAERGDDEHCFATDARQKNSALLELGITVNFSPVCDISTNPSDFIYDRTLGKEAGPTADYIRETVAAMEEVGMLSMLKHFPGYGNNVDTHTGVAIDQRPKEVFETSEFLPFRAGIEAGADFILVNHNVVTCMDAEFPASLSPEVHRVLREELGYEGIIITDDLAMAAVKTYAEAGRAAVQALLSGTDMVLTTDFEPQIREVLGAVEDGTLSSQRIDEACLRVLRYKLKDT